MPETYAYKVKDQNGRLIEGSLEAENTALVANKLRRRLPIDVDELRELQG